MFSEAVRSSVTQILRQVWWWSAAMVTEYDIISSRWSSQFWVKIHVFSAFNNKIKSSGKNPAKRLFMCHLPCKAQKITISCSFILISNSWWNPRWQPLLVTSQASSSAITHEIYLILLRRGFPLEVNSFQNTATYQKLRGGVLPTPPPPLYHSGGMNLHVHPRVDNHDSRTNTNLTWVTWENQYSPSH